jgi:hypothetical protein
MRARQTDSVQQADGYDSTIIVIAPIPSAADRGWRRLIQRIDPKATGAYALDGQTLQPGGCYRTKIGALIVIVDTYHDHRSIRLLRVHPGGLETVKEWQQKAPLGQRIVTFIARRLPDETWRAAPVAGVSNRHPGRCYRCGQDLPRGAGTVVTVQGRAMVSHADQCPPAQPVENQRAGTCWKCGKPVAARTGWAQRDWDDLTGVTIWLVEHKTGADCDESPEHLPNRWPDWCPNCHRFIRAGEGVWKDGAARCSHECAQGPSMPMWRISRTGDEYQPGETFRAVVAPRTGEADAPSGAPGRQVLDEGMVSVVVTVVDTKSRDDHRRMALVRPATWEEASTILAEEVDLAIDARPQPRGFMAAFSAERIGPTRPWVAQITGHDRAYGYRRTFLRSRHDYQGASHSGNSGVVFRWVLAPNTPYEVFRPTSWKRSERLFVRVTADGGVEEISRKQVDAMLLHTTAWVDPCTLTERGN